MFVYVWLNWFPWRDQGILQKPHSTRPNFASFHCFASFLMCHKIFVMKYNFENIINKLTRTKASLSAWINVTRRETGFAIVCCFWLDAKKYWEKKIAFNEIYRKFITYWADFRAVTNFMIIIRVNSIEIITQHMIEWHFGDIRSDYLEFQSGICDLDNNWNHFFHLWKESLWQNIHH